MKQYELGFVMTLIIILVASVVALISIKVTGQNDGPIEQEAEAVIQDMTGVRIDFSPEDKK